MVSDLELIEQIVHLLKVNNKSNEPFVRTDLSSILPQGESGYSINQYNQVTGVKIGRALGTAKTEIFKIIVNFKSLERLVIYMHEPFEVPVEIASLNKLKYLAFDKVTKLPKELFYRGLQISDTGTEVNRNFTANHEKVSKRFELFKINNPRLKIPAPIEHIFLKEPVKSLNREVSSGLQLELRLFCALSDKTRHRILAQTGIFITHLSDIKDPPFEVVNQGLDAIIQYFKEKEKQGIERLYEAKIVIVGAGESGKTTLIRKLQNPKHPVPNAEDKRTEGIRVTAYPFRGRTKDGVKDIMANIWDFGGQELYHTTHQLFLTADTLYILLNDNRKNDTDFYYWLNIVTLRAGDTSPILMVFNAKDNAARQIIPGEEIYSTFPNLIKHSIDVNFADKDIAPIKKMKQTIEKHFNCLEVLGKPFPSFWVKVREALAQLSQEHINWNKFREICELNGIVDTSQMEVLAKTLHNLGVLLYFPDVFGLDDLIILKSQWCIDAIYSALDTKNIIEHGGRFNEQSLAEKWSGHRFAGNHLQLLKLMQHFDLCYKIDGSNDYIAPQLLPIEEQRLTKKSLKWALIFQFDYVFMPAGLITRLIARMSMYIKTPYVWRSGVVLEWDCGTIAEIVEHQLTHKIVIKINGAERKRRLVEIRKCLYDLQRDFRGLKFKEAVSCNCPDCIKGGEVTIYELKELEDDAEHNDTVTCRNGARKKIPAKNVLNGITYEYKPRIFISYSHKNEEFKNEFRTMISPMEKEGHWKVWDDRWLLPGDNWNEEIIKHLNEADVIVLMLTAEFFKSNFIYEIELARALQRHESGDALIIGIVVSDCMWEETPLSKIQILPKDGQPVSQNINRSEVWKAVALKIKETILARKGESQRLGGWNLDQ